MNKTSIEWTDLSANPLKYRTADGRVVWGCAKVSAGCTYCYSETIAERFKKGGPYNEGVTAGLEPFLDEKELHRMLTYKPAAGKRVFVGDMTDVFGEWVPDDLLDRLFAVFALRPDVTFQILTKRPERMRTYFAGDPDELLQRWGDQALSLGQPDEDAEEAIARLECVQCVDYPLQNVWLGTSVENQETADARIPHLLQTPAAVRFISAEPLLGPIDMRKTGPLAGWMGNVTHLLDWVIVGGESGPKARPCDAGWIRSVVSQCQATDCPVFVKQLGSNVRDRNDAGFMGEEPEHWPEIHVERDAIEHDLDGTRDGYQGAPVRIHLRDRKGGDPSEWPEELRVREMPQIGAPA